MLPVAQAVAFAAKMGAALGAKMKAAGGDITGANFSNVEQALEDLRAKAEDAISRDEQEANTLWTELGAVVRHGWDYFEAKREFNVGATAAKMGLRTAIAAAQAIVRARVEPHADAPERLRAVSDQWRQKQARVQASAGVIPALKAVEGWTGTSAGQYSAAAELQATAAASYSTYVQAVQQGYKSASDLNSAVMFTLAQDISNAAKAIAGTNSTLSSSGGAYYRRTCAAHSTINNSLSAVFADLNGGVAGDAAGALSAQLDQARSSSTVLSPGAWPTGTDSGGHRPENMNTVSRPQNVDTSSTSTGPTNTSGVNY